MTEVKVGLAPMTKRLSNTEIAKSFEKLLIGSSADNFREFEKRISHFCPFEAIGMVRQEVRHAHFLSYILDPNRPHPFNDDLLKVFLQKVAMDAQEGSTNFQPLQIHCSDFTSALIYRERADIDLLIEVPSNPSAPNNKGMVITIELKVDAVESEHQLEKYRSYVLVEYPARDWDHTFVFLTLDKALPTDSNTKSWIPVGLTDLVELFDQEVDTRKFSGEAADLYRKYSSMIRRNLMEDPHLTQLAKSIWGKHKEALEALYDFRPDLQAEVLSWIDGNSKKLFDAVERETGFSLEKDTSTARIRRFSVKQWQEIPGFCDRNAEWIATGSLIVLELADWGSGRLRLSFVLGQGDEEVRDRIYNEVLRCVDNKQVSIGRRTTKIGHFKHLSAKDAQSRTDYARAEDGEEDAEEMGQKAILRISTFLKSHLPVYDDILRRVLEA